MVSRINAALVIVLSTSFMGACLADEGEPVASSAEALNNPTGGCKKRSPGNLDTLRNMQQFTNPDGFHATYSTTSGHELDLSNPFFQSLGTNGRTCATCHTPEDAWSVSAASIRARFEESCGEDPIFRTVDGSTSPHADTSTLAAKRVAYSTLLEKGLIRIERRIPANAQFRLVGVEDPYGNDTSTAISVFRRPVPSTNLKFIPTIMWDVREPDLASQAQNATLGHAEAAAPLSADVLNQIVAFETSLFTTQVVRRTAGNTSTEGAKGDPFALAAQPFEVNENRPPPRGTGFTPNVFTIYDAWAASDSEHRASIARGQALFNFRQAPDPFIPANAPPGTDPMVTCTTCHNSFNAGSFAGAKDAPTAFGGFANVRISTPEFRTPDLPLYKFEVLVNNAFPPFTAGQIIYSTDPGIALTTGLLRDFNRFKAPPLRGLAARAPYFHNGSAQDLAAVVDHYNEIVPFNFSPAEKADLVNFLSSL